MKFNLKLFSISFIFALIAGAPAAFPTYFIAYLVNSFGAEYAGTLAMYLGIVSFIINPIIIFIVFYFLGRRYDLPKMIGEVVLSVFLGLVIGYYLMNILLFNISIYLYPPSNPSDILYVYLIQIYGAALSSLGAFFVIIASLALSYFRSNKNKAEPPQPTRLP